jgi:3-hydroxyisobutyrate dehydrogenase-like beta-hydroxyacid dehydrogenase
MRQSLATAFRLRNLPGARPMCYESVAVSTIGFIGLGLLGHALSSRVLAAGHGVIGYDVSPDRVDALVTLGGKAAASAADVAARTETICVVLPTLASVEDTILASGGIVAHARAGTTVIQMSTISPALTERLAREVTAHALAFLDCPVSGTSAMVARGDGLIMGGGDEAVFARTRPLLEAMLPRVIHVGPAGHAMLLKLVANLLVGIHSLAAAEALSMARRGGLDLERVLEVLTAGAANSRMLEVRGPMIARAEFPAQMKLELFMKDLHLIQEAASTLGAPIPLTDVAERLYAAALGAGHGAEDLAVVVTALSGETRET